MSHTAKQVHKDQIEFLPIKSFLETYGLTYSVESVGYHMKQNQIDWMKPAKDRFVLVTPKTLTFYGLETEIDPLLG